MRRRVRFGPDGTGTAWISGTCLPVAQVAAAQGFVHAVARSVHAARDDDRTLAQVEADVALDLLQGRHLDTGDITPKVELVAPVQTWLALAGHLSPATAAASSNPVGTTGAGVKSLTPCPSPPFPSRRSPNSSARAARQLSPNVPALLARTDWSPVS